MRPNPLRWMRRHAVASVLGGVALVAVGAWLFFGVFAVHLLWVDDTVSEAAPFALDAGTTTTAPGAPPTTSGPTSEPAARTTREGRFVDRSHPTSGEARVITDGTRAFLRLEDLDTDNGPDLYVYLSANVDANSPSGALDDDFVNLGRLKGNIGDQNYELPASVDLDRYRTVVIWCRRFSVVFGAADLHVA